MVLLYLLQLLVGPCADFFEYLFAGTVSGGDDPFEKIRLDEAESLLAAAGESVRWLDNNGMVIPPEELMDFVDAYMYKLSETEHAELEHVRNLGKRVAYTPNPITHWGLIFPHRPYRFAKCCHRCG